ncbi:MAG TPA: peptide ABC transporter ATP-binding protein, partial [Chloroflexi bacterium]|nr:peptide ABC transporter ATP-binding protein [Chloroflexota bacterium]
MEPLLKVVELVKSFREGPLVLWAVNGVTFQIYPGETVGLVGESGCGKTTTARCILRLTEPTAGQVYFNGSDLTKLSPREMRAQRRNLQMVFQDPDTSLNPRFTVRRTLAEPLRLHNLVSRQRLEERLRETMIRVNMDLGFLDRYPHQLSEGQKQRVGVARAIITEPQFVALDEPTSSLDMSIRIHVIGLLQRLQEELGMTYLFISHDLSAVRNLCNRVLVMYLGRIVEAGPVEEIFERPLHHYTQALLSAIPIPEPGKRRQRILLRGEPPSLFDLP